MKLRCRYTSIKLEGDWVAIDDFVDYPECPECGAGEGDQCNAPDPESEGFGVEVSNYVHYQRSPEHMDDQ